MTSRICLSIVLGWASTVLVSFDSFAKAPYSPSPPTPANSVSAAKRSLGVVFATDGQPMQASIDFYRAVYQAVSASSSWDALPLPVIRKGLSATADHDKTQLGGVPSIDRSGFRKHLPRRSSKKANAKTTPGTPVPELQRFLDNTRSTAVIVVDCAKKDSVILRACGLYYYDRVSSKVIASAVKTFVSGASDVKLWATPMVQNLEDGLSAAQREKDQSVIEELIARNEEEDERDTKGLFALFGKGDRTAVSSGWRQTISGGGIQLGFLKDNVGAYAEWAQLSWSGTGSDITKAVRTNYGLSMLFRANALDALLWFFEMGGGKEKSAFTGVGDEDTLEVDGAYIHLSPGIGLELSEYVSMNAGIGWRWFFESSSSQTGTLKGVSLKNSNGPSLMLRATVLI